jgi:hypothetical protein
VMFTIELQKRIEKSGVLVFSVHPGGSKYQTNSNLYQKVPTEIGKDAPLLDAFVTAMWRVFGKTPKQGAQTSIFAAISPSLEGSVVICLIRIAGKGGAYLHDCTVGKPDPFSLDPANCKRLWDISEKLVHIEG